MPIYKVSYTRTYQYDFQVEAANDRDAENLAHDLGSEFVRDGYCDDSLTMHEIPERIKGDIFIDGGDDGKTYGWDYVY